MDKKRAETLAVEFMRRVAVDDVMVVPARDVLSLITAAIHDEREQCALVAEKEQETFLSFQYAMDQPLSSIGERLACRTVAREIRLRSEKEGEL